MTGKNGARSTDRAAMAFAVLFTLLAGYYSLTTPIFEAPDELWHYLVVVDLAHGHFSNPSGQARQEATQPPLYYALGAVLERIAPAPPPDRVLHLNPYFDYHLGNGTNLNFVYHGEDWEQFPFAGLARTVHLIRFLSVFFGALTVLGVFRLGRLVAPERPFVAPLAAGFCALLPQFLFLSGTINNDLAVTAACTWTMVFLVQWLRETRGAPPSDSARHGRRTLGFLAFSLGVALLSKASGFGLALLVGFALLRFAPSGEGVFARPRRGLAVLVPAFVVGGWWYLRLWLLYRDPLGTTVRDVALGRTVPFSVGEATSDLGELGLTFVARFGQTNLAPPLGVSLVYLLVVGAGLVFGLRVAWRERRAEVILQLLWIGAILVLFYLWQLSIPGAQGRLVFPALASIAVVWGLGIDEARRRAPRMLAGVGAGLGASALVSAVALPALTIVPAYRPHPDRLLATLPSTARPIHVSFGDSVDLVGDQLIVDPSGSVRARLFWRRGAHPDAALSFFVHAVDSSGQVVAGSDAALAPSLPLSDWPKGSVVEIDARLTPSLPRGSTERLDLGVYRLTGGTIRPVRVGPTEATSYPLAVLQPDQPAPAMNPPVIARFGSLPGQTIDLVGWALDTTSAPAGGQVSGRIQWLAPASVRNDYTVFVHLMRDGKLVAQHDSPPVHGFFPTTAWPANQVVHDTFAVSLPRAVDPGPVDLVVGLYDARTLRRLPVGSSDALTLTRIVITPGR